MSSSDIPELINTVIESRVAAASAALYLYEWLITFNQEVEQVWKRKWNLSTWVFAFNRYATFVYAISLTLPVPTLASCLAEVIAEETSNLLQDLSAAMFTGLRTSALCNRSIWIFLVTFGLSLAPFFASLVIYAKQSIFYMGPPATVCENFEPFTDKQWLGLSLITRLGVIVSDIIALAVLWRRAFGVVREASRHQIRISLGRVLIQDGTVLFLGVFTLNVFQLVSDNMSSTLEEIIGSGLIDIVAPILQNRFMLNLRQAAHGTTTRGESSDDPQTTFDSTLIFLLETLESHWTWTTMTTDGMKMQQSFLLVLQWLAAI